MDDTDFIYRFGSGLYNEEPSPYIRVGCNYFKVIEKLDRYGLKRTELKVWRKSEIIQDRGNEHLKRISLYDDFTMKPSNTNFELTINNCYNLYSQFIHVPEEGEWTWTERLLKHIFGEQYDIGLRYMQILYKHPDRSTIILALVSAERGTGKTTFLNWLNSLFGANMVFVSSPDLISNFNSHYANKNIVAIEETLLGNKQTIDKLKALATAKFIQVNEKFVPSYKIPCFTKIILTSNNEDNFAIIEAAEIRFLVRKLGKPEFINHKIEDDLIKEIPAFLNYLQSLQDVDWSVSRSGFTVEELRNKSLEAVFKESKSALCKELEEYISDYFNSSDKDTFSATTKDLKERFFSNNSKVGLHDIRTVLKKEIKNLQNEICRYMPFDSNKTEVGRPFHFNRADYVTKLPTGS